VQQKVVYYSHCLSYLVTLLASLSHLVQSFEVGSCISRILVMIQYQRLKLTPINAGFYVNPFQPRVPTIAVSVMSKSPAEFPSMYRICRTWRPLRRI
jgi:hypothetical protein